MMSLKDFSTDKIISTGIIIALIIWLVGTIIIALRSGQVPSSDLSMNIVTGLLGYMGGRTIGDKKKEADGNVGNSN